MFYFQINANYPAALSMINKQRHTANQLECREFLCQETPLLFYTIRKMTKTQRRGKFRIPISSVSLFKRHKLEAQLMKKRWGYCTANLISFLRKNLNQEDKTGLCLFCLLANFYWKSDLQWNLHSLLWHHLLSPDWLPEGEQLYDEKHIHHAAHSWAKFGYSEDSQHARLSFWTMKRGWLHE